MGKIPNFFAGIAFRAVESKVLHSQVELVHHLLPGASPPTVWHHRQGPGTFLSTPALPVFTGGDQVRPQPPPPGLGG